MTRRQRARSRWPAAVLAGAVLLVGCGGEDEPDADPAPSDRPSSSSAAPTPSGPASSPTGPARPDRTGRARVADEVAVGLTSPWAVVALDDGSLLVSERDTRQVKHLPAAGGRARVVATIDEARPDGEAGLLGLAVTPEQDRVYAYYTADDDNRIVAMSWDGRRLGPPEVVFDGIPIGDGNRHEGGGLAIGPDGLLYVGTGETGVTPEMAQDREALGGKTLRLRLDGRPAPDNPFGTAVYSWGHRNVEGLAFDDRGRLWSSEFGDQTWDELNRIEPGGNYGWPEVEGEGGEPDYVDPVAVWRTDAASPAGLAFWDGSLWMAGLRGETLWEIPLAADGTTEEPVPHLQGEYGRLRAVEPAADGRGLLVATSNTDGRGSVREGDDRLLLVTR